jgi:hypothetical protein
MSDDPFAADGGGEERDAPPVEADEEGPFGTNVGDDAAAEDPAEDDGQQQGDGDEDPFGAVVVGGDDGDDGAEEAADEEGQDAQPYGDDGDANPFGDVVGGDDEQDDDAEQYGGDDGDEAEEYGNRKSFHEDAFNAFTKDDDYADQFGIDAAFVDEEEGTHSVASSEQAKDDEEQEAAIEIVDEAEAEEPEEEKTYEEWEAATWRKRIFSIWEPSITEHMEQPPVPTAITWSYHSLYLVVLLANGFANVANTYTDAPVSGSILTSIKTVAACMFIFDLVTRAPLVSGRRYLFALALDALTSISEVILLTSGDMGFNEINYIPPLRSTRVFLFTGLFVRTETFRDINLAIRTVVESFRSLLVFIVLVIIGLLMYSTFVYLAERGEWNSEEQRWYRECHPFLSVCKGYELSPFQSIPDSMWLIIQSMTTVGYGDVTPTSTIGRVVTGCAIISGVFVIAFPAMVLIGNLDQSRRDFFASQEREELERNYRNREEEAKLEAEAATDFGRTENSRTFNGTGRYTRTNTSKSGGSDDDNEDDDDESESESEDGLAYEPSSKMLLYGIQSDMMSTYARAADLQAGASRRDFAVVTTSFEFMGDDSREVTRNPKGVWTYEPIFQLLTSPDDGLPLLSNVFAHHKEGAGKTYTAQLTLVIDDPEAQALASEAAERVDPEAPEPMAHAAPIFGLDVTFQRPVLDVIMRRRVTTGRIHEHTIPLSIEIVPTATASRAELLESVRRSIAKASLMIKYNKQPITSATWVKNVPVTSVMLSTTPFIQDLRAIAINIAPREYWPEKLRTGANEHARQRRNIAYISAHHLSALVYPIYKKVVSSSYVLRNITDFTETVASMIKLHCREVRKHDVPTPLRSCIYQADHLSDHERLYEVDVDYFRTIDWPLGTVPCEYSERLVKTELKPVRIAASCQFHQPVIANLEEFLRENVNEGDDESEADHDSPYPGKTHHTDFDAFA